MKYFFVTCHMHKETNLSDNDGLKCNMNMSFLVISKYD